MVSKINDPNFLHIKITEQPRRPDSYYNHIIDHDGDFYSPKYFTRNNLPPDTLFKITAYTVRVETNSFGINIEYYSTNKVLYVQTPKIKPRKPYIKLESWEDDQITGEIHSRIYVYDSDAGSEINYQAMPVDSRWRIYKDGIVPQEPNKVELSNSDRLLNQDEGAWDNEDEVDTEGQWRKGWRLRQTSGQFAFGHESPGEPIELEPDTLYNIYAQMKYNSVDDPWGPMESIQVRTKATSDDNEYQPDPEPLLIVARTHDSVQITSRFDRGSQWRWYPANSTIVPEWFVEPAQGKNTIEVIKGLTPDTNYHLEKRDKNTRPSSKPAMNHREYTTIYEEDVWTLKLESIIPEIEVYSIATFGQRILIPITFKPVEDITHIQYKLQRLTPTPGLFPDNFSEQEIKPVSTNFLQADFLVLENLNVNTEYALLIRVGNKTEDRWSQIIFNTIVR